MELSDDLPPPRRQLFFPVVIATIFLTIIGMSAGLVLSSRHRDSPGDDGLRPPPGVFEPLPTPSRTSRPVQLPTLKPTKTTKPPVSTPASPSPPDTPEFCLPDTQKAAADRFPTAGRLRTVLHLRTAQSDVWICRDDRGEMYYHANNNPGGPWIEGQTSLLLDNVVGNESDYHVTHPDGTRFSANHLRLYITHTDGRVEVQRAFTAG